MEQPKRTANQALTDLGFNGDKLIAYAHTIARHELNRKGSTLGDRYEDLVMYLVDVGCRTALQYNPAKSATTYTASSYIYDVMARRTTDFYRRKAEGFGDRRKGHDNRIELTNTIDLDEQTDALTQLIDDETISRYRKAADQQGKTLATWIHDTLEAAA